MRAAVPNGCLVESGLTQPAGLPTTRVPTSTLLLFKMGLRNPACWLYSFLAAIMLPYPQAALGLEITFVFIYIVVELIRLYLGRLMGPVGR